MPANEDCEPRMAEPPPEGTKVPTRRFGRTEIQMPVLTCGGMRAQWKWGDDSGMEIGGEITEECQANFDAVAEKAKGAGCLIWEPREEPYPVGYYCGVRDPDGNAVEFSYGQPLGPGTEDAAP